MSAGIARWLWKRLRPKRSRLRAIFDTAYMTLLCFILLTIPIFFFVLIPALHFTSYQDYKRICRNFEAMDGVRLIDSGYWKDITCEHPWATIDVKGKGIITFRNLDLDCFTNAAEFGISRLGPWGFEIRGYDQYVSGGVEPTPSMMSWFIEVGSGADYSKLFPFEIKNVQDVIGHYDQMLAVIETWPKKPETKVLMVCPDRFRSVPIKGWKSKDPNYVPPPATNGLQEIRVSIFRQDETSVDRAFGSEVKEVISMTSHTLQALPRASKSFPAKGIAGGGAGTTPR
ncbi:MAG: hypothetical protein ABFD69_15940 [Candidatus Sumerlaeia bacterium]